MKICMLNGSPKTGESFSGTILNRLEEDITASCKGAQIIQYKVYRPLNQETDYEQILTCDVLVTAFPLYVDGIPSNLLEELTKLEPYFKKVVSRPKLYVIVNNGFNDANQNRYAVEIMKHYAKKAGLEFGQAIAIGAGEATREMLKGGVPFGKATLAHLKKPWTDFVENIAAQLSAKSEYTHMKMPNLFFMKMANSTFWDANAKKNGISKKQLDTRLTL